MRLLAVVDCEVLGCSRVGGVLADKSSGLAGSLRLWVEGSQGGRLSLAGRRLLGAATTC